MKPVSRHAFTLLELLIAIAILAVAILVLWPLLSPTPKTPAPVPAKAVLNLQPDTGAITINNGDVLKVGPHGEQICQIIEIVQGKEPAVNVWYAGKDKSETTPLQNFKEQMKGLHIETVGVQGPEYKEIVSKYFTPRPPGPTSGPS